MTTTFSNADDVIDSRDVIARIEELRDERDAYTDDPEDGSSAHTWAGDNPDDAEELRVLEALADEASDYAPDWEHGETLIRDSYFVDYAREMLQDCGDLPANLPPYLHIDWDATARDIRTDYTAVDFDGVTYWIR